MLNRILDYFSEIANVPRCSKNEKGIVNYIINWAKKKNLSYNIDKYGNCLIYSSVNTEKRLILQTHVDMVCEKVRDSKHNFLTDPIRLVLEGDVLRAYDTSLGADNGIGMAISMVLMEEFSKELDLRLLFTVDEETGLNGAKALEKDFLDADFLINLDSEDDDTIIVGCAGGSDMIITKKLNRLPAISDSRYYRIELNGFNGGHSGVDIHKGFGNAIKGLLKVLKLSDVKKVVDIGGGTAHNAIPRYAYADIEYNLNIDMLEDVIKKVLCEFRKDSPDFKITNLSIPEYVFEFGEIIEVLEELPHGVYREFSREFSGVESSSNFAKIGINDDKIVIVESLRGASKSSLNEIKLYIESYLKGFEYYYCCEYPGWQPNKNSKLLEYARDIYFNMFKENAKVEIIHAGLECGILYDKNNSLDIISVGPNIRNPHSPDEKVYLSSIEKTYRFVYNIIKSI